MMIEILPGQTYPSYTYMSIEDAEHMANTKPVCALCDANYPLTKRTVIPLDTIDGKPTNGGYMLVSDEFARKMKELLDKHDTR